MPRAKHVQSVETFKNFQTGAKTSIGTSAVQLTSSSFKCKKGVLVKAASTNGVNLVYVGDSTVTAGSPDSTSGFELATSEWVLIETTDPSLVYVIGSTTGLAVTWVTV